MKIRNVEACSIERWLGIEKLRRWTFPTVVLPVPEEFVAYLLDDGSIFMSEERFPVSSKVASSANGDAHDENMDEDENEDDGPDPLQHPAIQRFEREIQVAIDDLGGSVFPKLNWSSPRDATWMTVEGSLRCNTASEIFLLLKSSDFILHDLTQAFESCEDYEPDDDATTTQQPRRTRPEKFYLALRTWTELNASMEFRCFVRNNRLVSISQRDYTNYYEFIHEIKHDLLNRITSFFNQNVKAIFPESDYVMDVYLSKRRVFIVDFNPFGPVTDALLFDWSELLQPSTSTSSSTPATPAIQTQDPSSELEQMMADLRLTPKEGQRRGNSNHFGLPTDMVDVSSREAIHAFAQLAASKGL